MTYVAGQLVRVASRAHEGHHRTPQYLKGKTGRVERLQGSYTNPETRAYGSDGLPLQRLYFVSFDHGEVLESAGAHARDRIFVDVYEHWLEDAE